MSSELQPGRLVRSRIAGGVFGCGDLFVVTRFADANYPLEFVCCRLAGSDASEREFYFRPEELVPAEEPVPS